MVGPTASRTGITNLIKWAITWVLWTTTSNAWEIRSRTRTISVPLDCSFRLCSHVLRAVKADVSQGKKTRERKEDVTLDERLEDILSAWINDDPMSCTSFGDEKITEPSVPTKCSDDALVDKGAEAPKLRLSPVKMRMLTPAASGLLHAGPAYKAQLRRIPVRQHARHSPSTAVSGT